MGEMRYEVMVLWCLSLGNGYCLKPAATFRIGSSCIVVVMCREFFDSFICGVGMSNELLSLSSAGMGDARDFGFFLCGAAWSGDSDWASEIK